MRNTSSLLKLLSFVAALAAALVLSACGSSSDDSVAVGDLGPDPATMAPADAPIYLQAVIRPQDEMKDNIEGALSKFGVDDPGGMIVQKLDADLAKDPGGITYSEDIEPWLGNRMGGFFTSYDLKTQKGEGAVAIGVTDPDAAQSFLDKVAESSDMPSTDETYQGVDYKLVSDGTAVGVDGDFLVIGTEDGLHQAVDAGAGDSLADDSDASDALGEIPDDSIFSGYVDTGSVIDLVEGSGVFTGAQLQQFRDQVKGYDSATPTKFWTTVDSDAITVAGAGPAPAGGGEPTDLISGFPSDAWFAFAGADLGAQFQGTLDQFKQGFEEGFGATAPTGLNVDPIAEFKRATGLDLATDFGWVGGFGGFVQGTSLFGLGAGLVIESGDDALAGETVDKLEAALEKQRAVQVAKTDTGFSLQVAGAPVGAEVAVEDGKFVVAGGGASVDDVLSPSDTLDDSDRFQQAGDVLGDDLTPSFYLDFPSLVSLIEGSGQVGGDPDYAMAKPYLDALDYMIAGSTVDDDRSTAGLVIGLREPSSTESTSAVITP